MANINETPIWRDGVLEIATTDEVKGGPDGVINQQARQLADRTAYLKQQVEAAGAVAADADTKASTVLERITAVEADVGTAQSAAVLASQHKDAAQVARDAALAAQGDAEAAAALAADKAQAAADALDDVFLKNQQTVAAAASAAASAASVAEGKAYILTARGEVLAAVADVESGAAAAAASVTAATTQADRATTQANLATSNGAAQVTLAQAQVALASGQAAAAASSASAANKAKSSAEAARDAAMLSSGVFATTAAGLAVTQSGRYFSVPSGSSSEYLILYLNNSGTAVEVKRYPSVSAVDGKENSPEGSPSYSNPGGQGDRTASIVAYVTPALLAAGGAASNLVDGAFAQNNSDSIAFNAVSVADQFISFDFGASAARVITEATWRQGTTASHGTWKWQGSNDGANWTDIGSSFTLGGATVQVQTTLAGNILAYRHYRLLGISGTASASPYIQEIEFKISRSIVEGYAKLTDLLSNTIDAAAKLRMPSNVVSYYPCDEGAGATLRDIIGGRTASINNGGGTVEWTVDGWLRLNNGWFKLPSQLTQTVVLLFRSPESHNGYYFAAPNQDAMGNSYYGAPTATVRSLHGWGISEIPRDSNAAGPGQIFSGGWCMISHQMAAPVANVTAIGCGNHNGAGVISNMEVAGIAILSGAATDAQLRQILNFAAATNRDRGIFLTPWHCPRQAHLAVVIGESTSEGTFPLTSLSAAQRSAMNEAVLIDARNNGSSTTNGRIMKRLSLAATYANNNPPGRSGDSGLEVGLLNARIARSNDGRPLHILKLANGSTFLVPSGSYTNAAGGTSTVASTRNAAEAVNSGMLYGLQIRNMRRMENIARNQGVGYTSVSLVYNEGLNDAYIGTGAVPSSGTYQGYIQAHYDKLKLMLGISNLKLICIKPHNPSGGLGGGDSDYPNTAAGTNRLTALGYIRTAFDSFKTANTADVSILDGDSFALNTPADYVHPSAAGYDAMGGAAEALFEYSTSVIPRA